MILTKQKTEKCVSMFKISDFPADLAWVLKVHLMEYAAHVSVPLHDRHLASQLGHRMITLCDRHWLLDGARRIRNRDPFRRGVCLRKEVRHGANERRSGQSEIQPTRTLHLCKGGEICSLTVTRIF
jgi:hypothetical protein